MEIAWPTIGSWSLAACCVIALMGWWLMRRDRRTAELKAALSKALAEEREARAEYAQAARVGKPEDVCIAARAVEEKRKRIQAIQRSLGVTLFLAAFILAGCRTAEPTERIVRLDAHVRIVAPGDTVPDYPEGEARWWLVTPTGLVSILPQLPQEVP